MPEDVLGEPVATTDEPLSGGTAGHGLGNGLAGGVAVLRRGRDGREQGQQNRKRLHRGPPRSRYTKARPMARSRASSGPHRASAPSPLTRGEGRSRQARRKRPSPLSEGEVGLP